MWLLISAAAIFAIIALCKYGALKTKRRRARQIAEFNTMFSVLEPCLPTIEFGSSYTFNTYVVHFQNKFDFYLAVEKGLIEKFKNWVKSYERSSKFDVNMAVSFKHGGYF